MPNIDPAGFGSQLYAYRAQLSDKIRKKGDDGDTVLLLIDQGLNDRAEEGIRLARVWAPETYQIGGREIADRAHQVMTDVTTRAHVHRRRWPFLVRTEPNAQPEPDEERSFVRYIGEMWAWDTGESINDMVIALIAEHPDWGGGTGSKP